MLEVVSHPRFLPEDMVFKILVRLPVADVIRCTCVCKQWSLLIKTPHFISTHLSLSSPSSSSRSFQPPIFIHQYSFSQKSHVFSLNFDPESVSDSRTIPFPFPPPNSLKIIGYIRGLFCVSADPRSEELYCLWNPSVRRYIRLPLPPTSSFNDNIRPKVLRGFGFDDKSEDYKVVLLVYLRGEDGLSDTPNCELFSLKQGSWRTVPSAAEEAKNCVVFGDGFLTNGALHWVAGKRRFVNRFVLAFDISRETFKKIQLPQELLHVSYDNSILEAKGLLACFDYDYARRIPRPQHMNCYSIWVMKEYGVANSWVKMWNFQLMGNVLRVYGFWGNGDEILIQKENSKGREHLLLCEIETQGTRDFGGVVKPYIFGICSLAYTYSIYTHTESLILLDNQSGAISNEEESIPDSNPLWFYSLSSLLSTVFHLVLCIWHWVFGGRGAPI